LYVDYWLHYNCENLLLSFKIWTLNYLSHSNDIILALIVQTSFHIWQLWKYMPTFEQTQMDLLTLNGNRYLIGHLITIVLTSCSLTLYILLERTMNPKTCSWILYFSTLNSNIYNYITRCLSSFMQWTYAICFTMHNYHYQ